MTIRTALAATFVLVIVLINLGALTLMGFAGATTIPQAPSTAAPMPIVGPRRPVTP